VGHVTAALGYGGSVSGGQNDFHLDQTKVFGNVAVTAAGGFTNVAVLPGGQSNPSEVSGAAGVTVNAGKFGTVFFNVIEELKIPNGNLTLTGTLGACSLSVGEPLTVGKEIKLTNADVRLAGSVAANALTLIGSESVSGDVVGTVAVTGPVKFTSAQGTIHVRLLGPLTAQSVTAVAGEGVALFTLAGADVTGPVSLTSGRGAATLSLGGATTEIDGAVAVTGLTDAAVQDEATGTARYRSTVKVTAGRGAANFVQTNDSTLTVDGAVTVKGGDSGLAQLSGSNAKTLAKDLTVAGGRGEAVVNLSGGKTTVGGSLTVKDALETHVTLTAGSGSAVAKSLSVTGGIGPDALTWGGGFRVAENAAIITGGGVAALAFGDAAAGTGVTKNLSVTTGNAADVVTVKNFGVGGVTAVKTNGGRDAIHIDASSFASAVSLDAGAGDDTLAIAQVDLNAATTFAGKATLRLGAGNDTLKLGRPAPDADKAVFSTAGSAIDGGLGYNVYEDDLGQGLATANLVLTLFTNPV